MFDLLIVTHGNLGTEFLATLDLVYGKPNGWINACGFLAKQSPEELYAQVEDYVWQSRNRGGCLIVTDIPGGSPFLMSARAYKKFHETIPVEVISGLNLGMLLEVASIQSEKTLSEAAEIACSSGMQSVKSLFTQLDL